MKDFCRTGPLTEEELEERRRERTRIGSRVPLSLFYEPQASLRFALKENRCRQRVLAKRENEKKRRLQEQATRGSFGLLALRPKHALMRNEVDGLLETRGSKQRRLPASGSGRRSDQLAPANVGTRPARKSAHEGDQC